MTECTARRWCRAILAINLVVGLAIALSVLAAMSDLTESRLPRFEQTTPQIPDWPSYKAKPHA